MLGLNDADKTMLGNILRCLKREFPDNDFLEILNTSIRNSITHYTYFFENEKLFLCRSYFDNSPERILLRDFMKEKKQLSILTESFLFSYLDKFSPESRLNDERF